MSVGTRTAGNTSRTSSSIAVRKAVLHVPNEQRLVPGRHQVTRDSPQKDRIDAAFADDLVGDGHVAASCIRNLRRLHRQSVRYSGPTPETISTVMQRLCPTVVLRLMTAELCQVLSGR